MAPLVSQKKGTPEVIPRLRGTYNGTQSLPSSGSSCPMLVKRCSCYTPPHSIKTAPLAKLPANVIIVQNLPCALVVKETICPLLEFLSNLLGLFMSLEPSLILLVEPPTLVLERARCQILLVGALLVVEDVEEGVGVNARV